MREPRNHEAMGRSTVSRLFGAAVAFALAASAPVVAEVDFDARASTGVSDNINLVFEGEPKTEETIQTVASTFAVRGGGARTDLDLAGNLQFARYLHESFDDQLLGGATLNFVGHLVPERFRWRITDNYGQQSLDPLGAINPENQRNINIFRTGPALVLPVGGRNRFDLQAIRAWTSVEQSNIDSARTTAQVAFTRQNSSVWASSIGVSSQTVEYQDVDGFDFDTSSAFVRVSATGGRSNLSFSLGSNRIENFAGDADGTTFSVAFRRQLAGSGTLIVNVTRGFSDAGNLFRLTQSNFLDVGQRQDIFATPDAFENTSGFISYLRTTPLADWAIQGFWRKDEFQTQTQFDRDEFGIRLFMRRDLPARLELGLNGGSVRRDLQGFRQEDDTHIWAVELMRRVGATMGVGVRRVYTLRDQMRTGFDRKENRYEVFYSYRRPRSGVVREPMNDSL
jgi:hypothetical protein